MDLPEKLEYHVSQSIRRQLKEHKHIKFQTEQGESIFLIKLDMCINGFALIDQFEWDINNTENSPELFARALAADLVLYIVLVLIIIGSK
jgi:SWI/SNF-related matrix-associated actin-dependent regulator of chromatin subfamily B protein 1